MRRASLGKTLKSNKDRNTAMPADVETVLMVVDNCQPVLTHCLKLIEKSKGNKEKSAKLIREYLITIAPEDVRRNGNGDQENGTLLRQSLIGATPDNWQTITTHYTNKFKEHTQHE